MVANWNFMDRTSNYAKLIVSGKKRSGKSEYLACQRHLEDMKRKDFEYTFDVKEAEKYINIANLLTIGEGIAKQQLKVRGFQEFIIGSLFGWRKKRSRVRRYREAYVQMARKNGKSFIAAVLCIFYSLFSGYRYGQIYLAATKQQQAEIVFNEVRKFIESDEELLGEYKITKSRSKMEALESGTIIRTLGRDTKSIDGFQPNLGVIDEYHAHKTNQMYKLIQDGQTFLDNALTIAITTAGFDLNSACYEHYEFCKKVLNGAIEKETLFVYICELDEEDEIWEQKNWLKANPLHLWNEDNTINEEMIKRMSEKAIEAKEKQGNELVNFMTKSLNKWVTVGNDAYIDVKKWRECGKYKTLKEMKNKECYLGIDLSSGGDLTSIALVFPLENETAYVYSHSYMPEMRLTEHIKTDDAPYQLWVQQNLLTLTSGLYGIKTDYKKIIEELKQLISEYELKIIGCGYDPHNASGFLSDLENVLDCDITEIVQSARSLNDATVDFKLSVEAGLVTYDKRNKLLSWSCVNAVLVRNSFGEVKVDKKMNTKRIDAVDAVICAWKLYFVNKGGKVDGEAALQAWLEMTG